MFLPNPVLLDQLCEPCSSGVWEFVWFYDLMTPVGSDQGARLNVASCCTPSHAQAGCPAHTGLVVEMELQFWSSSSLELDQVCRAGWAGGGQ